MLRCRARQGELALVDWHYNAWGGKYPPWDRDDAVPPRMASALSLPCFDAGFVLEGGSVDGADAGHEVDPVLVPDVAERVPPG